MDNFLLKFGVPQYSIYCFFLSNSRILSIKLKDPPPIKIKGIHFAIFDRLGKRGYLIMTVKLRISLVLVTEF